MATHFLLFGYCDFTVTMNNVDPIDYDPVLLILSAYDQNACVAYADDNGAGLGETITLTNMPPGYYWAVIDSEEGCGYWDLYLMVENCTPIPTETPTPEPTGTFTPEPTATGTPIVCDHDGDVNSDGGVTPGDAQLAFQFYLNCAGMAPTSEQYCAADFCGSGLITPCDSSVTPADAQGIMRFYLGYLTPCLKRKDIGTDGRWLTLNQTPGREPSTITVSVELTGTGRPVSAFGIELACGTAGAKLVNAEAGKLNPGWTMFQCTMGERGIVRIGAVSVADSVDSAQQGTLAHLTFSVPQASAATAHLPIRIISAVDDLAGAAVQ